jgi:hypothetical protein
MFVTFPIETGDRRRYPRSEVRLPGGLNFGRTAPQRSCTIKNISRGGARLHVGLLWRQWRKQSHAKTARREGRGLLTINEPLKKIAA